MGEIWRTGKPYSKIAHKTLFIPGVFCFGIILCYHVGEGVNAAVVAVSIICVISLAIEIMFYKQCKDCTGLVMHNVYSFSINAIIYCMCMIFVNIWFIWGVKYEKSSVVLSWVVITAMWWAQSFALVCVLMGMYITDSSLGWIVALACAIIAFMIFFYCILVGYGYWLEIRKTSQNPIPHQNHDPASLRN